MYIRINGSRLKSYRNRIGLSQTELGVRAGKYLGVDSRGKDREIAYATISEYERIDGKPRLKGHIEAIAMAIAERLEEKEKVDVEWGDIYNDLVCREESSEQVERHERQEDSLIQKKEELDKLVHYRQSLTECLQKELEKIHYQERILKAVRPFQLQPELGFSDSPEEEKLWTIEDLLRKHKYLLITAEPGMGKSTLLHKIALLATEDNKIPVYVDLDSHIVQKFITFKNHVWATALSYNGMMEIELSSEDIETQQFVFLFDNLDLVPCSSKNEVPKAVGFINSLLGERRETNDIFVVCCRANFDIYYTKLHCFFKHFILLELDTELDVQSLLQKYGIGKLHSGFEKNWRLLHFARNPYHMKMLVEIYEARRKEGKEPEIEREVEIYDQFIDLYLGQEEPKRATKESPELKRAALAWLAYESLTSDNESARQFRRIWTRSQLYKIIPELSEKLRLGSVNERLAIREILAEGLIGLSDDATCQLSRHRRQFLGFR